MSLVDTVSSENNQRSSRNSVQALYGSRYCIPSTRFIIRPVRSSAHALGPRGGRASDEARGGDARSQRSDGFGADSDVDSETDSDSVRFWGIVRSAGGGSRLAGHTGGVHGKDFSECGRDRPQVGCDRWPWPAMILIAGFNRNGPGPQPAGFGPAPSRATPEYKGPGGGQRAQGQGRETVEPP